MRTETRERGLGAPRPGPADWVGIDCESRLPGTREAGRAAAAGEWRRWFVAVTRRVIRDVHCSLLSMEYGAVWIVL